MLHQAGSVAVRDKGKAALQHHDSERREGRHILGLLNCPQQVGHKGDYRRLAERARL